MPSVLMRRQNNVLELSTNGGQLPATLQERLEAQLTYTHLTALRGADAIDPDTHAYRPLRSDRVPLYQYDSKGRFICSRGWEYRLRDLLAVAGYEVEYKILPPFPDMERHAFDFDRVYDRMELRARQDECLAAIASNDMGVIVAPTGFGKSYLFAAVCMLYPKAKIHVITKRRDVVKRLHRHLTKFIPNVGQVGAGKARWGRVTVVTADSMHKVDHTPQHEADIVLADEVHELMAPTYVEQLALYRTSRMYGFTATPDGRFDGAHYRIEGLFGRPIFEMTYPEAVELGLVVPVKVEWINVHIEKNPGEDYAETAKERWGIWRNDERNAMIAAKANEFAEDEQVLILVRSVEHAIYLKQHLPHFKLCYDKIDDAEYRGYVRNQLLDPDDEPQMISARRDRMQVEFEEGKLKKVIATDVWSTGVDFPQLAVLIRADARSSEIIDIQAPGRVVRKHDASGKQYGLVVDLMDHFDGTFLRRSQQRRRNYKAQGWEQVTPGGGRTTRPVTPMPDGPPARAVNSSGRYPGDQPTLFDVEEEAPA